MRRSIRVVTVVSAVSLLMLGPTEAAFAQDGFALAVNSAAKTEYQDYGDLITVTDRIKDSHGAVGWIEVQQSNGSYKAFPHVYNGGGANTYVSVQQDVLRETAKYKVVSCIQDGSSGRPYNCGFWYGNG